MRALLLTALLVALVGASAPQSALAAAYALQPVRGPKGSAPRDVERAILDRLETRGDEGHLGDPKPGERLITVRIKKRGRVFRATVALTAPGGGESLVRRVLTYHPRRGVSSTFAVLVDRLLDASASDDGAASSEGDSELPDGEGADEAEGEPSESPMSPEEAEEGNGEFVAVDEAEESEEREAPSAQPPTRSDTTESAGLNRAPPATDYGLTFGVALGTQMLSRYTVSVETGPTALAYRASPLFLIAPTIGFSPPGLPLWLSLQAELASVGFTLSTEPPLTPAVTSGMFWSLGLDLGWAVAFGGTVSLSPILGLRIENLVVQEQSVLVPGEGGEPTAQPFDVVLSSLAVVPELGLLARFAASDRLDLSAFARFRVVASYSESPASTGEAGPGLGFSLGAAAAWHMLEWLSFELRVRYQYSAVSFAGAGTRPTFADDPSLVDARLAFEDLKLSVGPMLRF